jgi:hypothetical protein
VKSIGRCEKLVRTLAPTEINTIDCYFVQLHGISKEKVTKMLESKSPSEFPPLEVGNSKR